MCSSPNHIVAYTAQVLDFSYCVVQFSFNALNGNILLINSAEIALGALMCLLVVIQFIRESLQMYKATKRFRLNHYMTLLVREGMIYFVVYVYVSSLVLFPLPYNQTNGELL